MRQEDIDNWFEYHAPSAAQIAQYAAIRAKAKHLAERFNEAVPDCADKTAAMRHLRETVMAMNLAIACYVETQFQTFLADPPDAPADTQDRKKPPSRAGTNYRIKII